MTSVIGTAWVTEVNATVATHASVSTRALTSAEVAALEAGGNRTSEGTWAAVKVRNEGPAFNPAAVARCVFVGAVELGCFQGSVEVQKGIKVPCGVRDTVVANSSIHGSAVVASTGLLANTIVLGDVAVVGCGSISTSGVTAFANGIKLPLGLDGDGRLTPVYASITVGEAANYAQHLGDIKAYEALVASVVSAVQRDHNVFSTGSRVTNCSRLTDLLLLPHARVDGAIVERATVLSSAEDHSVIEGGAVVRDALLQWGTHIDTMACVDAAVVCEGGHVDRHGKLLGSLLGPMSGVSEGEVSASLVGPLVGFHHQALLIAALWPEGKGNVGYGANVGSNHTSKAPDQEIRPGEGVFFGLGTCIKFPANYQKSPYTVIATGVCALPQKVEFPFSLINTPGESITGLSPAINEISPGWTLSDSVYTIWRNQHKFEKRCKSRRHVIETSVFRADTVALMIEGRRALANPKSAAKLKDARGGAVWTDREIAGLGKNYMTEAARIKGIEVYTRYIRLYALQRLARRAVSEGMRIDLSAGTMIGSDPSPLSTEPASTWEADAKLLADEFQSQADIPALLALFHRMLGEEAELARVAKAKDSARGKVIIPDYDAVHPSADSDAVVKWMRGRATGGIPSKL